MSGCQPIEDRDYSDIAFPGDFPQPRPTWEVVLKIGTCVLVELVAVLGNLLLIAVVVRSPRMRSTTNCYIANMAVADLLIALVPMWIHVSTDVISMDNDAWPLGGFLCKFNSFVQVTAMVASVLMLMAIAGDRFFAIFFPFKARVTERRVGVVVVAVWLCALGIGLPPLFFYTYKERQWKDYLETFCTDVWPAVSTSSGGCDKGLTSKRAYWTVVTVVLNWLPMAVMAVVYALIVHRLRFSRLRPNTACDSLSAIQRRSKRKVVKMLLMMLVAFMLCTIPFQVTNFYSIYSHHTLDKLPAWHKPVYYAAVFLMYTNSAVNPILYGGLNEKSRSEVRQLLCCLLCRQDAGAAGLGLSASTRMTLSRMPRVSIVEDEVRKVKKEKKDLKTSLCQLAVSAACIDTALAAATDKGRRMDTDWRRPVVNLDPQPIVTDDLVDHGHHFGNGILPVQNPEDIGDHITAVTSNGFMQDSAVMYWEEDSEHSCVAVNSGDQKHGQNPDDIGDIKTAMTGNGVLSGQNPGDVYNLKTAATGNGVLPGHSSDAGVHNPVVTGDGMLLYSKNPAVAGDNNTAVTSNGILSGQASSDNGDPNIAVIGNGVLGPDDSSDQKTAVTDNGVLPVHSSDIGDLKTSPGVLPGQNPEDIGDNISAGNVNRVLHDHSSDVGNQKTALTNDGFML